MAQGRPGAERQAVRDKSAAKCPALGSVSRWHHPAGKTGGTTEVKPFVQLFRDTPGLDGRFFVYRGVRHL